MLHEKLECYYRSVSLAEELSKEGSAWPRGLGYLQDQLRRAMTSVVLNIAEGNLKKPGLGTRNPGSGIGDPTCNRQSPYHRSTIAFPSPHHRFTIAL